MPLLGFGRGGVFFTHLPIARRVFPSDRSPHQTEPLQPTAEPFDVLLDPVLHNVRAVPNVA